MNKSFHITKREGQPTLGAKRLFHALKTLDEGDWNVTISDWKDSRSLRQNNLYWKWVDICADIRGYSKDGMHEAFLEAFAPIKTIKKLDGKVKQKKIRSSEMDTQQMSDYMRLVDREAAENGTVLPRPEKELLKRLGL